MLKQRIITALLLVPLVLGALFFLPLKFFALLAANLGFRFYARRVVGLPGRPAPRALPAGSNR